MKKRNISSSENKQPASNAHPTQIKTSTPFNSHGCKYLFKKDTAKESLNESLKENTVDLSGVQNGITFLQSRLSDNSQDQILLSYEESHAEKPNELAVLREQVRFLIDCHLEMKSNLSHSSSRIASLEKELASCQEAIYSQTEKYNKDIFELAENISINSSTQAAREIAERKLSFSVACALSEINAQELDSLEQERERLRGQISVLSEHSKSFLAKRKRQALEIELSIVDLKIASVKNKI